MPDTDWNCRLARWLTLFLVGVVAAVGFASVASAQSAPARKGAKRGTEEKQACIKNLKAINGAIRAFQAEHHDLPNWLSDLVPQYLDDLNVLICPVCRRTGQSLARPMADPKLPSSYVFMFCPVPLGKAATNAPTRTHREWRRRQMGLLGSDVPVVQCRFHRPRLNLAFDGKIYESPVSWELAFTNRVSAAELTPDRLFADETPRPARATQKASAKKSRQAGTESNAKD
ncbi:MAG TPA: hypothetical protein P5205_04895 [Candidatus Paceibacterota bacterium]|nr:hypothetical protein [Verrucomicrobiota bacterium]HSA09690.1 hypothetical protein [Candidatus Paceibacterota bacterium]